MLRLNLHLTNQYSFLYPCYVAESNDNRPISVDGYKSCDSVNVKLKKGIITSLSPNPAETQVSVAYRLAPTITEGSVQLTNMMGMVVKSEPLNITSTIVNLNVSDLIYGQYTVKLVASNGEVLDSKVLIVRQS